MGQEAFLLMLAKMLALRLDQTRKGPGKNKRKKTLKVKRDERQWKLFKSHWRSYLNIISLPARTGVETGRISVLK